jgi:hypothetical protein
LALTEVGNRRQQSGIMKLVFLAHRTPYPPNKGEKIRAFHSFLHLAESHACVRLAERFWISSKG